MTNKKFTKEFGIKKCSTCNGEGSITVYSHGCWGEPDNYSRCCSVCGGNGFIIPFEIVSRIKIELGITPDTKFGRGEQCK